MIFVCVNNYVYYYIFEYAMLMCRILNYSEAILKHVIHATSDQNLNGLFKAAMNSDLMCTRDAI